MGDRRGIGAEPDDHLGVELQREIDHGARERAPVVIGFGAHEEEGLGAFVIGRGTQFEHRPGEAGVDPVDQMHRGSSSAVIEKDVGVEGRDGFHLGLLDDGRQRLRGPEAGVDPAVQPEYESGGLERGALDQLVEAHR